MIRIRIKYTITLVVLLTSYSGISQPSRHWNVNLDAESSLMGGAVVSGDLGGPGSIFYNPALITGDYSSNFSFNASLGTLSIYRADNYLYSDNSLNETNLFFSPKFFSFFYQPKNNERLAFEFSTFTKDLVDMDVGESNTRIGDIYESISGVEQVDNYIQLKNDYREQWYGLGSSYQLNSRIRIGASIFVIHKRLRDNQNYTYNIFPVDQVTLPGDDSTSTFVTNLSSLSRITVSNYRALLKLGGSYRVGNFDFGLNITTPSFNGLGAGESDRSLTVTNFWDDDSQAFLSDETRTASEDDLKGQFKDPFSVSLGITYASANEKSLISVVYGLFSKLGSYQVVNASESLLQYQYGATSVHNVALGYRYQTARENYLMFGFRTDFDYMKNFEDEGSNLFSQQGTVFYDVYHFSGGGKFKLLKNDITLGLQYSFGSDPDPTYRLLDDLSEIFPRNDQGTNSSFKYDSFSIFAGFTLNFGRDLANLLEEKIIR